MVREVQISMCMHLSLTSLCLYVHVLCFYVCTYSWQRALIWFVGYRFAYVCIVFLYFCVYMCMSCISTCAHAQVKGRHHGSWGTDFCMYVDRRGTRFALVHISRRSCTFSPYSPSLSTGFWLTKSADFSLALSLLYLVQTRRVCKRVPRRPMYCISVFVCVCLGFLCAYWTCSSQRTPSWFVRYRFSVILQFLRNADMCMYCAEVTWHILYSIPRYYSMLQ